jgi:hypothetical protein
LLSCESASPDDTYRNVWLRDGEQAEGTMMVEESLTLQRSEADTRHGTAQVGDRADVTLVIHLRP